MDKTRQLALLDKAVQEGLIENDPRWLESLEAPLPAWAVLEIAIRLLEKLNPPGSSYD